LSRDTRSPTPAPAYVLPCLESLADGECLTDPALADPW